MGDEDKLLMQLFQYQKIMKVGYEDLENTPYEWIQLAITLHNLEQQREKKEIKKQQAKNRVKRQ